ncbi:transporter [Micromonospora rosaria]|uniref:Transporter n=1 Tax=Micromonospora rosaria TaxID=47874 RepID=A0A136PV67_9ACTN|nr:MFS transporter [Micromonospora rosaria]KXK62430.1 transporter [Micromonospora rosaria]
MTATAQARGKPAGVLATLRATPPSARYLLGGVLINQAGAFVQPFLVLYLTQQGLSVGRAGTALAAYSAGAVLGLLLGGELTHRLGARMTIAAAMASSAVLVMLIPSFASTSRFTYLLIVVGVAGAFMQAYRPAAAALLSDVMPAEHRVMAFSMLRIAMNVGAAVGPLLAAALILVDWDLLFYVNGFTALTYALLAVALLPQTGRTDGPAGDTSGVLPGRAAYAVLARDGRFLLYLASMLLSAVMFAQFTTTLPLKVAAAGHPPALYSAALVTSSVLVILCELKVTTYVSTWVAAVAAAGGTTVMSLGIAGYAFVDVSAALVIVATVVFVSGMMVSGPTLWAHPAKAPAAVKGRYIGASQAVFGLGSAIGPVVGVFAWTQWGDGVWLLTLVVGLTSAATAAVGLRERPDGAAQVTAKL